MRPQMIQRQTFLLIRISLGLDMSMLMTYILRSSFSGCSISHLSLLASSTSRRKGACRLLLLVLSCCAGRAQDVAT